MNDEMARRLSEVTTFRRLRRLSLADNYRLGPAGIAAILQAEFVPRLEALCLDADGFDDGLVQLLVESPLSATVHLSIRRGRGLVARDTIAKRFPNWSYNDRFIEREL